MEKSLVLVTAVKWGAVNNHVGKNGKNYSLLLFYKDKKLALNTIAVRTRGLI